MHWIDRVVIGCQSDRCALNWPCCYWVSFPAPRWRARPETWPSSCVAVLLVGIASRTPMPHNNSNNSSSNNSCRPRQDNSLQQHKPPPPPLPPPPPAPPPLPPPVPPLSQSQHSLSSRRRTPLLLLLVSQRAHKGLRQLLSRLWILHQPVWWILYRWRRGAKEMGLMLLFRWVR